MLNVPVYDLLGGKRRDRVPVCFPIFRMFSHEDVAARCALVRTQFERGFDHFRFYFGYDTNADQELLECICGEYGDRLTLFHIRQQKADCSL